MNAIKRLGNKATKLTEGFKVTNTLLSREVSKDSVNSISSKLSKNIKDNKGIDKEEIAMNAINLAGEKVVSSGDKKVVNLGSD